MAQHDIRVSPSFSGLRLTTMASVAIRAFAPGVLPLVLGMVIEPSVAEAMQVATAFA